MTTIYDTIVIGGGASGLMAAGRAAERGKKVLLLEKMGQTGRKIGISGKGRCNLTNSTDLTDFLTKFGKNGRFLRQCFHSFFSEELMHFFTTKGLPLVKERGNRIFPQSGKALDVVLVLNRWLQEKSVVIEKSSSAQEILIEENKIVGVKTAKKRYQCCSVVLATGGKSYPKTGSTGDGYSLAMHLGHTLTPIRPSLVPLKSSDPILKPLSGLELRNILLHYYINDKKKGEEFGELTFIDQGISGPTVLRCSGKLVDSMRSGKKVHLSVDLKPALDDKKLDNRLIRDLEKRGGESISSILRGLLPQQLIDACLVSCCIEENINTKTLPAQTRKKIGKWLKNFTITINGYQSFDEAIITAGGIQLNEIDPKSMESKIIKNLYIVGEILDLQANTGGYNLQAAFSMGWLAGSHA